MSYIRKILLTLITVNVLILVLHSTIPAAWSAATSTPVDDWQYYATSQNSLSETNQDPMRSLKEAPYYLAGTWLILELIRLILAMGFGISAIATAFIIFLLASVSGPMIGSITDQGRASAERSGFSAGGAKDINNFRANIAAGYLPQPTDITYEGLFYDYSFNTGKPAVESQPGNKKLFLPTWSSAVSRNPRSGEVEHFLAVGLKSELDATRFARKKLNMVVVLDISGSMESPFDRYYYGNRRARPDMTGESAQMSKLKSACSSIVAMLGHLRPDDRLGIVLFDHDAHLAKPVALISLTDMAALKKHILELETNGATNMEEGLEMASDMLKPYIFNNPDEYENRIIFLTDAMPNTDDTSESGLLDIARQMAENRIYTTFIGMGLDFNSQLIKSISQVRGANYYSVHSPTDFKKRLVDEFECMVNPMVFDLTLTLKAPGYRIKKVIGSPEADMATGRIMQVKTLFPAPTDETGTRGGIILLQLEKLSEDPNITLTVNYADRMGREGDVTGTFTFKNREPEHFDDAGIRKGIVLARYADLIKDSATGKHQRSAPAAEKDADGSGWSYWERPARPLTVSTIARSEISKFRDYLQLEISAICDNTLEREVHVLNQLSRIVENKEVSQ
ncbi:MAG: hypothetical protein CVV41_09200 [Candidatus Riflebacteria bacterium HGW-Riflebacteria-1]|jgi:Ca-activated chloride channel family protein|nr:MAG: hypothetical protein CVV41_09200 [Candidatus Riflebacteria bacterium HGW-Riflebacteria-1]